MYVLLKVIIYLSFETEIYLLYLELDSLNILYVNVRLLKI